MLTTTFIPGNTLASVRSNATASDGSPGSITSDNMPRPYTSMKRYLTIPLPRQAPDFSVKYELTGCNAAAGPGRRQLGVWEHRPAATPSRSQPRVSPASALLVQVTAQETTSDDGLRLLSWLIPMLACLWSHTAASAPRSSPTGRPRQATTAPRPQQHSLLVKVVHDGVLVLVPQPPLTHAHMLCIRLDPGLLGDD